MSRRDWHADAILQEVYSTGALMELLVGRELQAVGVRPQLFSFLGWIAMLEPVTPGALAAETGMPPTTIRDNVRALVARGDVRKAPHPRDGRSYLLETTAQGRAVMERGAPALTAAYARLEPHLVRPSAEYVERAVELRAALREALAAPAARAPA